MYYHVLACVIMCYYVLSCVIMCYQILATILGIIWSEFYMPIAENDSEQLSFNRIDFCNREEKLWLKTFDKITKYFTRKPVASRLNTELRPKISIFSRQCSHKKHWLQIFLQSLFKLWKRLLHYLGIKSSWKDVWKPQKLMSWKSFVNIIFQIYLLVVFLERLASTSKYLPSISKFLLGNSNPSTSKYFQVITCVKLYFPSTCSSRTIGKDW